MKNLTLIPLLITLSFVANAGKKTVESAAVQVEKNEKKSAETIIKPASSLTQTTSVTTELSSELFEEVVLSESTTINLLGQKFELRPVSHGIRKKKVFGLATVKVYVAELFSANPDKLEKTEDGILNSLKKSEAIQLKLTMTRDLSGKKISDSFKEALESNGLDPKALSTELNSVLNELLTVEEFKRNETISLTSVWKDTKATLIIQKPNGQIKEIQGDEKFVNDLFSIWFGKPADDKLADLKKSLIK